MKTIELKIVGMSCQHCVMAVKNALKQFDLANLSIEIGKVTFEEDGKANLQEIAKAIEEAGYKVL